MVKSSFALDCFRYAEAFARLFYPSACGICDTLLDLHEKWFCPSCSKSLESKRYTPALSIDALAGTSLDEAWALYCYDSPLDRVITAVKFFNQRRFLKYFAPKIEHFAAALLSETPYEAIVPIPLSWRKRVTRQFNQAAILANFIGKKYAIPVTPYLFKIPGIRQQSSLDRTERMTNLKNAFRITPFSRIKGKSILLVDDIITTGATAQAAAKCLRKAGAKRVDLIALAYTPRTGKLS